MPETRDPLVIRDLEFLGGMAVQGGWRPPESLPEVAFIGRSNVGKSSLLNLLVRRKAFARVSRTPGRTQEVNFFRVNQDFILVDLPGYGYARVSKTRRHSGRRNRPRPGHSARRNTAQMADARRMFQRDTMWR